MREGIQFALEHASDPLSILGTVGESPNTDRFDVELYNVGSPNVVIK